MVIIKKYGNRRLYDTDSSRYITLEELSDKIRAGANVRVLDAKTNEDLTQATLTQIIIESGAAKLLPVPLLTQLIRMGDDALAEFFGQYLVSALDMYLSARDSAQAMAPYNPFATLPFSASSAFARMFGGAPPPMPWQRPAPPPRRAPAPETQRGKRREPEPPPPDDDLDDLDDLDDSHDEPPPDDDDAHDGAAAAPTRSPRDSDMAEMRRELDELKQLLRAQVAQKKRR